MSLLSQVAGLADSACRTRVSAQSFRNRAVQGNGLPNSGEPTAGRGQPPAAAMHGDDAVKRALVRLIEATGGAENVRRRRVPMA
ncbi:hypothetical protein SAMN05216553_106237 [Lentzea fradiae]|uniref:Uncharacterized protein n=1 Tax=Lentzea fradiae TaxID=200378 RepID=A0A1G7SFX0_9PSEU|nr:hypothetical protein SAMN05216553_106237 [Lentzea fradiae]